MSSTTSKSNEYQKDKEKHFSEHDKEFNKDVNKDWNKDKDLNKDLNKDLHQKDKEKHFSEHDKEFNKDLNKDKDWHKDQDLNKDWNKDKDVTRPADAAVAGGGAMHRDVNKDKTDTFGTKKEHDKDVDMKDKSHENKGFMDTVKENLDNVKEKVKVALSGDKDKDSAYNTETKKAKYDPYSKENDDARFGTERHDLHKDKDVGISGGISGGVSKDKQHDTYNKEKDKNVGISGGVHAGASSGSSGQYPTNLGTSAASDKYPSNPEYDKHHSGVTYAPHDKAATHDTAVMHDKSATHDKSAAGISATGTHGKAAMGASHEKPIVDRTGLGAEHREAAYDKNANVIADKNKDIVDTHSGIKSTAAGSSAGTHASSYKTTESK